MKQTSKTLSILLALLMIFSMMSTVSAAGLTVESATIGDTPVAEAAEIHGNDTILLTFSGNVTNDSVWAFNSGKIQVKDSNGTAVSSSLSIVGGKKVAVILGDLEKATYTLTIGKEFKDTADNTLGTKYELTFTVNKGNGTGTGGGNNPLSFVSAKADGKDLKDAELAATGTITITFNRGMTENQADNFAQISILDKDGKKAEGVTFSDFTKDDSGNSYTVLSYKDLAGGAYTLKLGKDLKANNGNTLGEDMTISFTVKSADKETEKETAIGALIRSIIDAIMTFIKSIAKLFK